MVHLNKANYGSSIKKNFQTAAALGMVCETKKRRSSTEAIELCIQGKDWIIPEYATAAFSFFDMMQTGFTHDYMQLEMEKIHTSIKKRSILTGPIILSQEAYNKVIWNLFWQEISLKGSTKSIHDSPASTEHALMRCKRLVISGLIIFATIMGILSTTTSAVTAHVISVNEAHKFMDAEVLHREEDIENGITYNEINIGKTNNLSISVDHLRHASIHSSNAVTNVMDSLDKTIQYSDPALEDFSEDIRSMVSQDTKGLLDLEIESMVKLASNTATVVTTIIPINGPSARCDNRLLMKTLYITVVNRRTMTVIVKEGDRLYPASGDKTRYLLIPQDGVLSKSAELFNQDIHMVGRTCWAHHSINATASPASDALFQTFTLEIMGNMSITESCPHNESWISTNWTISSFTELNLPVTCKLASEKFNCSAVSLKSSETKKIHLPHHRMTILEQHWDENEVNINQTKFIRSNITMETRRTYFPSLPSLKQFSHLKIPLLCAGGAVFLILLVAISIKLAVSRANGAVNVNVQNSNTTNK